MHKGQDTAWIMQIRSKRGPNSDPRDGRVFRQIRHAAQGIDPNQPITTRQLIEYCYPREMMAGTLKPWMRKYVIRQAKKVAIPLRRKGLGSGRGRPFVWTPIEEKMELRSHIGKWRRRQARKAKQGT